jgi:hypothetical protein
MRKWRRQAVDGFGDFSGCDQVPARRGGNAQNGLTTTKITMPIMRIVGTSLIIL